MLYKITLSIFALLVLASVGYYVFSQFNEKTSNTKGVTETLTLGADDTSISKAYMESNKDTTFVAREDVPVPKYNVRGSGTLVAENHNPGDDRWVDVYINGRYVSSLGRPSSSYSSDSPSSFGVLLSAVRNQNEIVLVGSPDVQADVAFEVSRLEDVDPVPDIWGKTSEVTVGCVDVDSERRSQILSDLSLVPEKYVVLQVCSFGTTEESDVTVSSSPVQDFSSSYDKEAIIDVFMELHQSIVQKDAEKFKLLMEYSYVNGVVSGAIEESKVEEIAAMHADALLMEEGSAVPGELNRELFTVRPVDDGFDVRYDDRPLLINIVVDGEPKSGFGASFVRLVNETYVLVP